MKVLVADDDQFTRRVVSTLIRRLGYEVCEAKDGLEAFAAIHVPDPPRLAVLDWVMPGLDGLVLCHAIRAQSVDHYTYIILLTAKDSTSEMIEGLDSGADDLIAKPVDQDVLRARLRVGQRLIEMHEQLIAARERLRQQATHDALTGLLNRGSILEIMQGELVRCIREQQSLGVVMCDLDHFKRVNDTYGHLAGDQILRQSAQRLRAAVRRGDYVGRYGGEEFLVLLPGCTASQTMEMADRICREIYQSPVSYQDGYISISMSLGTVTYPSPGLKTVTDLLLRADECLLKAKRGGRNRAISLEATATPLREPLASCCTAAVTR